LQLAESFGNAAEIATFKAVARWRGLPCL
jgi:hypothetical protein